VHQYSAAPGIPPRTDPLLQEGALHCTNWSDTVEKQRKEDIITTTAPTTGPLQHHTSPEYLPGHLPYLGKGTVHIVQPVEEQNKLFYMAVEEKQSASARF